jgi:hypothetical protein
MRSGGRPIGHKGRKMDRLSRRLLMPILVY